MPSRPFSKGSTPCQVRQGAIQYLVVLSSREGAAYYMLWTMLAREERANTTCCGIEPGHTTYSGIEGDFS